MGHTIGYTVITTAAGATDAENDASDFVDFAHGTAFESASNIVNSGLNREASLTAMVFSKEPGSFFAVKVDPLNPSDALGMAASWATRHNPDDICIVICRLPRSGIESLESSRLLIHTFGPPQSVFRPDAFEIVNREARWFLRRVR